MKKSKYENKVKELEELEILESDDSNFNEECEKMEEISLLENKSEEQIIAEIMINRLIKNLVLKEQENINLKSIQKFYSSLYWANSGLTLNVCPELLFARLIQSRVLLTRWQCQYRFLAGGREVPLGRLQEVLTLRVFPRITLRLSCVRGSQLSVVRRVRSCRICA